MVRHGKTWLFVLASKRVVLTDRPPVPETGEDKRPFPKRQRSLARRRLSGSTCEKIPYAAMGRLLDIDRLTVVNFVKSCRLTAKKADD